MSDDKDRKAGPTANGPKPATKTTIVGVPALPADRPSDLELTRELPPKANVPAAQPSSTLVGSIEPEPEGSEPNTALDVKAISSAEAERVLAWTGFTQEEIPTAQAGARASSSPKPPGVAGALPKPTQRTPLKTPPLGSDTFKGLQGPGTGARMAPEKPTRPGVAPQPGISPRGRQTLLLDSSVPQSSNLRDGDTSERPPIVVPSSASTRPKAVTQAPPWGEGAVRMTPSIPKTPPPPRTHDHGAEELSASLLLPADSTGEIAGAEELSMSLLIEEPPGGKGPGSKAPPLPPGKSSVPPPVTRTSGPPARGPSMPPAGKTPSIPPARPAGGSVKPPVPKPSARPAAAQQGLPPGMPQLPKATPPPNVDFASAAPADVPVPTPVPEPVFADAAWPPPPAAKTTTPGVASHSSNAPAPTNPSTPPDAMSGDIELTQLPRGGLAPVIEKLGQQLRKVGPALRRLGPALKKLEPALRKLQPALAKIEAALDKLLSKLPAGSPLRASPRPKWFLPVVAIAGLVIGVGLVGILVALVHGHGETASDRGTSASAHPSSLPSSAPVPASASPTPAPSVALAPCTVSGAPHVIAPSAIVAAGVEVVRLRDDVAVGFAPTDRDAVAARLDVTSVSAKASVKARSADPVRRVTPTMTAKGALALAIDADKKNDAVQGRRTVLTDPPLQLGTSDGALVSTRPGGAATGKLWPLDPGDSADALRGAVDGEGDHAVAIAFRRSGAVWMGTASGSLQAPKGDLSRISGLGPSIGSPAVAMNRGVALVAWSDRSASSEPWHLRWVRFAAGESASAPHDFTPPAGGKGSQTMSPGLAALPGGRFLLVWTEGPAEGHDVRALTLGPDGQAIGAPLVISNPGVNAGQGQAAVTSAGQGVVAFLESAGSGFQVVATPIACGP